MLERLERAIAHTLEAIPTEPDATGGIPGLQGLSSAQGIKPVETYLNPEPKLEEVNRLSSAAGLPTLDTSSKPSPVVKPPAWAVAAGKQLNLVGHEAEEERVQPKERPVSASPLGQSVLPDMASAPISAALSSAERDLHRHAGCGHTARPSDCLLYTSPSPRD